MDMSAKTRQFWSSKVFDFVQEIGLPITAVAESDELEKAFIPYVRVRAGGLEVCVDRVFPGAILHDAGHLCCLPPQFRALANDCLSVALKAAANYGYDDPMAFFDPDSPLARGAMQSGEAEALAWQYAAAQAIGLPDEWIFGKDALQGNGDFVLMQLRANSHLGIQGLRAAGWTQSRANQYCPLPVYPKLAFWLSTAGA